MKLVLLLLTLLMVTNTQAQFDVSKYFTDSISFSYQAFSSTKEKNKETTSTNIEKYIVRIQGDMFRVTQIHSQNGVVTNEDQLDYEEGKLSSISFYNSKIREHTEFNAVVGKKTYSGYTVPAQVFVISFQVKEDPAPWFARQSRYFGRTAISSVPMYFPSQKAAQDVKDYLETLNKIYSNNDVAASTGDALETLPPDNCSKDTRYINKTYGYTLCLDAKETVTELTYAKYNYVYLKDFVSIKGYSDLPMYVYTIDLKGENDSLKVYKKFEEEFFDRMGNDAITKKEIFNTTYTPVSKIAAHGAYFRGYNVTLKSGGEAHICFEYMKEGNSKFGALCFAYISPGAMEGLVYTLHNSALLLQSRVLKFK